MGRVPQALAERPILDLRQAYYYSVFQGISRSRGVSMAGPLPIPISEILSYCLLFQIDNLNERERIFKYVNRMDSAYLDHAAEKSKK